MPSPSKPRPGAELLEAEIYAALIGQVIDGLEMFQAPSPQPALEEEIARLRFVRGVLEHAAVALEAQAKAGAR